MHTKDKQAQNNKEDKMFHRIENSDSNFQQEIKNCTFPVSEFNHRAHLRLAYIYLTISENSAQAIQLMQQSIIGLLRHINVAPSEKYHHTMTTAWILAVHHFMNKTPKAISANAFILQNPEILNKDIMLTHYSAAVLFSDEARQTFLEPNLEPIPRYL